MTTNRSLRRHLALAVLRAAMITAGLVGSYAGVNAMLPDLIETQVPHPVPATSDDIAAHLLETQCSAYGPDVIPGHAVVEMGGEVVYTDSHLALESLADDTIDIRVFDFCL